MTTETIREAARRLPLPLPCGDARRDARAMADIVRLVVPDLVGMTLVGHDPDGGRPRTLAATGDDAALLDALQYLAGATIPARSPAGARWVRLGTGPRTAPWGALMGATGLGVGAVLGVDAEDRSGSAPAAALTVHLYARRAEGPAEGQVGAVATAVAAWAARLGVARSAFLAADAPRPPEQEPLGRQGDTARAVARVAVQQGVDVAVARASLHDAARRAGLPEHRLARVLAHPARPRRR